MATETREPITAPAGQPSPPVLLSPAQQVLLKLNDLFEPAESLRWLEAPQARLGGSPIELIERGQAERLLHILIRLEEGIHI